MDPPALSRGRRAWSSLLCGLALAAAAAGAKGACLGAPAGAAPVSIHVVPQFTPTRIYTQWAPLLDRLGRAAGLCMALRVAASIPLFEQALLKGEPDLAFANPYHAVLARRRQGYEPLLADSQHKLSGILVVRADSPLTALRQLQGARVAFPAPNAFAASLLPRAWLARQGVRIEAQYVTTHSNVYRAVIQGDVLAGGGVNNTLMREPAEVRDMLRVFHTTPGFAPHPLVVHPRVPARTRQAFVEAFLALEADAAGRELLEGVQMPKPAPVSYERDYRPLEALGLDKLLVIDGG